MDKKTIRREIREFKKKCTTELLTDISQQIMNRLEALDSFREAKSVICYWSMADEVATHDFVNKWYRKKEFYLPRVVGDNLEFRLFEGAEKMVKEPIYGIEEPIGRPLEQFMNIDLIIVPGVAFDYLGNRMGRGKGFYDRILHSLSCEKIGLGFSFQLIETIPVEEHDIPMDTILTENDLLLFC